MADHPCSGIETAFESLRYTDPNAMPLTPGDKLGPYEIVALIGKGGMGEV